MTNFKEFIIDAIIGGCDPLAWDCISLTTKGLMSYDKEQDQCYKWKRSGLESLDDTDLKAVYVRYRHAKARLLNGVVAAE